MSTQHQYVDINPPYLGVTKERFIFSNYDCPVCHGKGYFLEEIGKDEYKRKVCTCCDGCGKMKANVLIQWTPDEE